MTPKSAEKSRPATLSTVTAVASTLDISMGYEEQKNRVEHPSKWTSAATSEDADCDCEKKNFEGNSERQTINKLIDRCQDEGADDDD